MKILVLGINYWPEETGIGVFNTGRCEYLAAEGHDVTICTGFPYYPRWRVPDPYRGRWFAREKRNGVRIHRSYLYVPRRVTALRRIVHEASFVAASTIHALAGGRPDVILTVSPPLALGAASILLAKRWGVPYVFHVPDLQPDAAADLGMLKPGRVLDVLYGLERQAYRHAARVSTLTEPMRAKIVGKGIPAAKVLRFPDWVDPALFRVPLRGGGETFRRSFDVGDRFLVVHAGNMGVKQGLDVVLDAADRTRDDPRVLYLLVGDGAVRGDLEARATARDLRNVRFLPLQDTATFHDLLAASDVALITQQRSVADIVFPSKVLTLLAAGRPVIASLNATSEVADVLRSSEGGIVVVPEDGTALSDAVVRLAAEPERRAAMGEAGRAYARAHWDRDRLLAHMEQELVAVSQHRELSFVPRSYSTEGGST